MNEPLISVIVPIYNAGKYLEKCIQSISNQSYHNIELLLIDDGSQDNSFEICNKWKDKDNRIKIIVKQNGGAASARNVGLEHALGEYISFVDSDDWLDQRMFSEMIRIMLKENADILEIPIYKTSDEALISDNLDGNIFVFDSMVALKELILERRFHQTPCNKLYKRSIIGNIRFIEGKYIDDEYWTYKIFANAEKIVNYQKYYYYYRQHNKSAMGRAFNEGRFDALDALEERCMFIDKKHPELWIYAYDSYVGTCYYLLQCLYRNKEFDKFEKYKENTIYRIKSVSLRKHIVLIIHKPIKQFIWRLLLLLFPISTVKVRNYLKVGL